MITVFLFWKKQCERRTWTCYALKRRRELLGSRLKAHLFSLLSHPLWVAWGLWVSQVVWISFHVCSRQGRISRRMDLPGGRRRGWGGSKGKDGPQRLHPKHLQGLRSSSMTLHPPVSPPHPREDWTQLSLVYGLLTRWQPVATREVVECLAPAFPQGSLSSVAAKCCSVESSGNKTVFVA